MVLNKDYEMFLEALSGLLIIDKDCKLVYMNSQCADYIKADKDKSIGRHIRDVFPPTTMPEMLKGEKRFNLQFYFTEGRMSVSNQVQLRKNNEVVGVLEYDMIQDIESLDELFKKYSVSIKSEMEYYREQRRKFSQTKYSIDNIIGHSRVIQDLKQQIEFASNSTSTVLILGETGTGKELVAHSIHNLSARAFNDFIKLNSAGMPENLIESELFGYEEGAFTGAKKGGKKGKFLLANKGTLFIDEINQMPLGLQPKLLRALQENEIDPIGSEKSIGVDVRIIAASNEDLFKKAKNDEFREDLYYRLNVFPIVVPPLRERLDDLPDLVEAKIKELNLQMGSNIVKVDDRVYSRLMKHSWPGNIRELYNVVERMMNYARGETLTEATLDIALMRDESVQIAESEADEAHGGGASLIERVKNEAERELIVSVLRRVNGNKTQAADYLHIARPLLYQKLKRLGVTEKDYL